MLLKSLTIAVRRMGKSTAIGGTTSIMRIDKITQGNPGIS